MAAFEVTLSNGNKERLKKFEADTKAEAVDKAERRAGLGFQVIDVICMEEETHEVEALDSDSIEHTDGQDDQETERDAPKPEHADGVLVGVLGHQQDAGLDCGRCGAAERASVDLCQQLGRAQAAIELLVMTIEQTDHPARDLVVQHARAAQEPSYTDLMSALVDFHFPPKTDEYPW